MSNIIPHQFSISKKERNLKNQHNSMVIWFTGLSGSGKSTIANSLEKELFKNGIQTFSLDGDNVRGGLNKGLGFSKEDRQENLRRIAEVTKLFIDAGIVVVASFISPLREDRDFIKNIVGEENFIEVFVNTSLEECERRDVKGLYKKARKGEIENFTGISAPYEEPKDADLEIKTEEMSIDNAVKSINIYIKKKLEIL
jgi:adenylylsulfate kinase